MDRDSECCICLEKLTIKQCIITKCNHIFHMECLREIKTCPQCRHTLEYNKPIKPIILTADGLNSSSEYFDRMYSENLDRMCSENFEIRNLYVDDLYVRGNIYRNGKELIATQTWVSEEIKLLKDEINRLKSIINNP